MYLKLKFALIAFLLLALAAFNFVVDPYGIYLPDTSFSFNRNKTQFFMKEPLIKPYRVAEVDPAIVILGISNAGLGYDEAHQCFQGKALYNFSMAGTSMYMLYRAYQHAQAQGQLERVILDLNLISFNEHHLEVAPPRAGSESGANVFESQLEVKEDGNRNWLAPFRSVAQAPRFLLSLSTTQDSLRTLQMQGPFDAWRLNSTGGWTGSTLSPQQSQARRFMTRVKHLFGSFFSEMSATGEFSIYREDGTPSRAFDYYERLLADAYARNVDVKLVISPAHAYYYEALYYLGLGDMFADWKRQLVLINERVARSQGKTPYTVWDFARYSELTTEPLPANADKTARMTWHFDPIHFKRALGDKLLDQVCLGGEGFGIELNVGNLEDELALQLQDRERFKRGHEDAVMRLRELFSQVSGKKPL